MDECEHGSRRDTHRQDGGLRMRPNVADGDESQQVYKLGELKREIKLKPETMYAMAVVTVK